MNKMNLVLSEDIELINVLKLMNNHFDVTVKKETIHLTKHEFSESFSLKPYFTDKERKVLLFLKQGLTYAEIAIPMKMSIDGVRYYVKKIYKKLGVSNARQAVVAADSLRLKPH